MICLKPPHAAMMMSPHRPGTDPEPLPGQAAEYIMVAYDLLFRGCRSARGDPCFGGERSPFRHIQKIALLLLLRNTSHITVNIRLIAP